MGNTSSSSNGGPARRKPSKAGSSVLTPPVGMPTVPSQREATGAPLTPPTAPVTPPKTVIDPCVCGHARDANEHYRPGTDCGACGVRDCADYRRAGGAVRQMLRRLFL